MLLPSFFLQPRVSHGQSTGKRALADSKAVHARHETTRDIARLTKRPIKTVNRIIQAHRTDRRIKDAPRKPRSRVTSLEEDLNIVAVAAVKPGASVREIRRMVGVQASKTTIKRRLHEAGLKSRITAQKPLLRVANKEKRLQFARQHLSWTTQNWAKVVFSDECTFTTCWDQKARVWRPANSL